MRDWNGLVRHILIVLPLVSATPVFAVPNDIESVPHLDSSGKEAYRAFLNAPQHRAFAIAPGGAWAWKADERSTGAAREAALEACQETTEQNCVVYAADTQVVFDTKSWATIWRPYLTSAEASHSASGTERGKRFFDLSFKNSGGSSMKLSDLRGKIVLLHFWGSWCPPCQRELPELQKVQQALRKSSDIQTVLLQVREDFATSRKAIARQHLRLTLHDSGARDSKDDTLRLADGTILHDRDIAAVFPTTYVLDKHGIVLFSHVGPVSDWMGYLPLLKDAAAHAGK